MAEEFDPPLGAGGEADLVAFERESAAEREPEIGLPRGAVHIGDQREGDPHVAVPFRLVDDARRLAAQAVEVVRAAAPASADHVPGLGALFFLGGPPRDAPRDEVVDGAGHFHGGGIADLGGRSIGTSSSVICSRNCSRRSSRLSCQPSSSSGRTARPATTRSPARSSSSATRARRWPARSASSAKANCR